MHSSTSKGNDLAISDFKKQSNELHDTTNHKLDEIKKRVITFVIHIELNCSSSNLKIILFQKNSIYSLKAFSKNTNLLTLFNFFPNSEVITDDRN